MDKKYKKKIKIECEVWIPEEHADALSDKEEEETFWNYIKLAVKYWEQDLDQRRNKNV